MPVTHSATLARQPRDERSDFAQLGDIAGFRLSDEPMAHLRKLVEVRLTVWEAADYSAHCGGWVHTILAAGEAEDGCADLIYGRLARH